MSVVQYSSALQLSRLTCTVTTNDTISGEMNKGGPKIYIMIAGSHTLNMSRNVVVRCGNEIKDSEEENKEPGQFFLKKD